MSDILWLAIMRSEIRSPTTKARSPILLSHLLRRYPHRHEACITNHPIGNERMNRIVGEEIRLWVFLTPINEAFVLCSCDHGIALGTKLPSFWVGVCRVANVKAWFSYPGWQGQHAYGMNERSPQVR